MSTADELGAVLRTGRDFRASRAEIVAAFERADVLARWWGPAGFSNTFERFEFAPGGRWVFTMHGPDGRAYANESVFLEAGRGGRIVVDHVSPPRFTLTVTLTEREEGGTRLEWEQAFENAETAARLRGVCEPANEENLDRLGAVLGEGGRLRRQMAKLQIAKGPNGEGAD